MLKRYQLNEIFSYAIAAILLIDCRAMIGYMDITPNWWFTFKNFLMIILLVITMLIRNQGKYVISMRKFELIILLGLYLSFYLLINRYAIFSNFQRIVIVLLLLLYSSLESKNDGIIELLCKYKNLVFLVALSSLVLWFLGCILKLNINSYVIYTSWSGTYNLRRVQSYYGVCNLIGSIDIFGKTIPKNASIFTEAPMASLNFCIALIIEVLLEKKV